MFPINLPVIDISKATPEAGKAMVDAAIKYGFLYVDSASSDIPMDDVETMFGMVSGCSYHTISYHIIYYHKEFPVHESMLENKRVTSS